MTEEKISIRDRIRLIPVGKSRTFKCESMLAARSIQGTVSQVTLLYPNPSVSKYVTSIDKDNLTITVTAVPKEANSEN